MKVLFVCSGNNKKLDIAPFITIISGALLIKPDMSHLETWPDINKTGRTYLMVDGDGDNLVDVISSVANNPAGYTRIIEGSKKVYRNALVELDNREFEFLIEATATKTEYDLLYVEHAVS